jgi:hypothetical protein
MKGLVVSITEYHVKYRKEWLSKYDNFILLVYAYLYRFNSIEHYVPVTIKDMVSYFKFKPDRNSGRINDKFKAAIKSLLDMGYITFISCYSDKDIKSFVDKESTDKNIKFAVNDNIMIWFKLNNFESVDYWNPSGDFVQLTYSELDTILNYKNTKNVDKVISTYLNIKKWISVVDSETSRFVAFPSENKLANDIGCSSRSIQEYVKQLIDAKLLYKKNYGSFRRLRKGEEIKQNANTVYALDKKYLDGKYDKDALINYMKSNYQMIGDDFEPFNQPLNEYQKTKALSDGLITSVDSVEEVHTNPVSVDNVSCDEILTEIEAEQDNSYEVKVNNFKEKSIAEMNEHELVGYMGWNKENGIKNSDNEDIMPWEEEKFEDLIS